MTNVPFMISKDSLTVVLQGKPLSIASSHLNYERIVEHLKNDTGTEDALAPLTNVAASIRSLLTVGDVDVTQDAILYRGEEIHSFLTQRMLEMLRLDLNIEPWAKFMGKLYEHPSAAAREELFLWLTQAQMPITQDGNFLAYKKVKLDYSSFHRGPDGDTVYNRVGETVEMDRESVNPDRYQTCSHGLHFCSWSYLPHYYGSQGRVVILEIDPRDVVAIPADYENAKGRAWKYKVVGEVPESQTSHLFDGRPLIIDVDTLDEEDDPDFFNWYD